ncbi:hypothetical protein DIPPA_25213 [Diplonema papillatum]|nr:hypothetical protein DIPPA_25213 [Diplonema papillatum]|eukprot:gene8414-12969_t
MHPNSGTYTYEQKVCAIWKGLEGGDGMVGCGEWVGAMVEVGLDPETGKDLYEHCGRGTEAELLEFFGPHPILMEAVWKRVEIMVARKLARRAKRESDMLARQLQDAEKTRDDCINDVPVKETELLRAVSNDQAAQAMLRPVSIHNDNRAPCSALYESSGLITSPERCSEFGQKLMDIWYNKQGSILDELLANLKSPASSTKQKRLATAGHALFDVHGKDYPGLCVLELLSLHLYTMAAPDVDGLMGFSDAPEYDEGDKAKWEAYRSRNPVVFRTMNWALRTAAEGREESWRVVQTWVRVIVLLMALASEPQPHPRLARGLAALPPQVLKEHLAKAPGDALFWPAASSCAVDPAISRSYIEGTSANATQSAGTDEGAILFVVDDSGSGVDLQKISKYPKEAEVLLPPLTELFVEHAKPGGPHDRSSTASSRALESDAGAGAPAGGKPAYAEMRLRWASVAGQKQLKQLCNDAREDARRASEELAPFLAAAGDAVHRARCGVAAEEARKCREAVAHRESVRRRIDGIGAEIDRKADSVAAARDRLEELLRLVEQQKQCIADLEGEKAALHATSSAFQQDFRHAQAAVNDAEQARDEAQKRAAELQPAAEESRAAQEQEALQASQDVADKKREAGNAKLAYREALVYEEDVRRYKASAEQKASEAEEQATAVATDLGEASEADNNIVLIEQEVRVCEQRDALRRNEISHKMQLKALKENRSSIPSHRSVRSERRSV